MPKFRFKAETVDAVVYDGELVGMGDPCFGKVVPGTCPMWCAEVMQEGETLAMREVVEGGFLKVPDEGLFFGRGGAWRKLEPGFRIIRADNGDLDVLSAVDFLELFEPA